MPLTTTKIRGAKPRDKPYKLADGRGLYLLVTPSGGKWWRWDYRFGGRRKTLSMGVFPDVELEDARNRRDAARKPSFTKEFRGALRVRHTELNLCGCVCIEVPSPEGVNASA